MTGPERRERGGWLSAVGGGVALGVSLFAALAGLLVWAWTDSDASACRNALAVALAPGQCSSVTFWHDIAAAVLWAGVVVSVLIIAAMILRGRRS